jgi:hypothetical protein
VIALPQRAGLGRLAFGVAVAMLIGASFVPSTPSAEASATGATTIVAAPTPTPTPRLGFVVEPQPGLVKQGG